MSGDTAKHLPTSNSDHQGVTDPFYACLWQDITAEQEQASRLH